MKAISKWELMLFLSYWHLPSLIPSEMLFLLFCVMTGRCLITDSRSSPMLIAAFWIGLPWECGNLFWQAELDLNQTSVSHLFLEAKQFGSSCHLCGWMRFLHKSQWKSAESSIKLVGNCQGDLILKNLLAAWLKQVVLFL